MEKLFFFLVIHVSLIKFIKLTLDGVSNINGSINKYLNKKGYKICLGLVILKSGQTINNYKKKR